jgi:hypothetical protein
MGSWGSIRRKVGQKTEGVIMIGENKESFKNV